MPFMQTDLQKIMGMEFSEDKVQYLVYQMLKGLKVCGAYMVAKATSLLRASPLLWGRGGHLSFSHRAYALCVFQLDAKTFRRFRRLQKAMACSLPH